jgi:hypothetical protein
MAALRRHKWSVAAELYRNVNRMISGKNATHIPLYSTFSHTGTGTYVRNPDCWMSLEKVRSCVSVYRGFGGSELGLTTIGKSGRYVIGCAHAPSSSVVVGWECRWLGMDDVVYSRTITDRVASIITPETEFPYTIDWIIGKLDSAVPTAGVCGAKVLPANWREYINARPQPAGAYDDPTNGQALPLIGINKSWNAVLFEATSIDTENNFPLLTYGAGVRYIPSQPVRRAPWIPFSYANIPGDSGNPAFMAVNGEPVLIVTWTGVASGPTAANAGYVGAINDTIASLGGTADDFVEEVDLSGYDRLVT